MKVAFVFPGQGAQEVGMGRALAERYPAAREVFSRADRALAGDAIPLSTLCFEGPASALVLTANTQPAVLTMSLAALAALRERVPSLRPAVVAGHSLGEYSALVCAGALSLEAAVLRGQAMQEACAPGEGAMSAVLGLEDAAVQALCEEVRAQLPGRVVSPANFNAPSQVVIAGHADAVLRAEALVAERRGRALPLKVSAPFHCALMAPAAERLERALEGVPIGDLEVPVVPNVDPAAHQDRARVKDHLVRQVAGTVRWTEGARALSALGVDTVLELGPGTVLKGLLKRIDRNLRVYNVSDPATLDEAVQALGGG
jgi:[acyl-carrier-protein] S-malonyltransferase